MAACGINSIRTYTVPPRWLLDSAQRHGLRVLVGLPWEQHVAFSGGLAPRRRIERNVRQGVRACAEHPAIPVRHPATKYPRGLSAGTARPESRTLFGGFGRRPRRRIEALVTYANYPSTEYLELPFVDFHCYNVYLENTRSFEAYLARLQNLVGDKPLVLGEIGFDSYRNGGDAGKSAHPPVSASLPLAAPALSFLDGRMSGTAADRTFWIGVSA